MPESDGNLATISRMETAPELTDTTSAGIKLLERFIRCHLLLLPGKMNRILWWLIAGSKGGANRASMIMSLKDSPCNAHQLSERLSLDYKTVQHHLRILDENRLVVSQGGGYGKVYFLAKELEANYQEFLEIWERVGKK